MIYTNNDLCGMVGDCPAEPRKVRVLISQQSLSAVVHSSHKEEPPVAKLLKTVHYPKY